jgi:uncharacterized Zn-binding protein involved in type VI secretion
MGAFIGLNQDVAGGAVTATATKTNVEGKKPLRIGDPVAPHGIGPHAAAVMAQGSSTVIVEGIGVCRHGDAASCGHTLTATATKSKAG